ncbi:TPA: hypothetical protein N3A33_005366, partial [Salmonella enterica subsp. salamae serovar 28:r:e,n,z15]|nr:hypothetical protein [Salmonella enterica subsp. salamae serovar 28:r:e,n,z15]
ITITGQSITSTAGRLDITLLGAGGDTGMLKVQNSILNSNGGNITLDQLNRTTTGTDGSSLNSPYAMTAVVLNSTLNTISSADAMQAGDLSISARNPNVNLKQTAYTNTVRNGNSLLQVGGGSILTAGNITLSTVLEGGNAAGGPVLLNGTTMTAQHDILLRGTSLPVTTTSTAPDGTVTTCTSNPSVASLEFRGAGNTLTSTNGNITIENNASGNFVGIFLNGTSGGKVVLNAGNGAITLNGSSVTGGGINVQNTTLNAARAIYMSGMPLKGSNNRDTVAINNSGLKAGQINISAGVGDRGNLYNGVSILNTTLDADAVDVSGVTRNNNKAGVLLSCATVNATDINISGSALGNGAGVQLSNITLNGDKASIKAVSEDSTGFNISNITRQGGLSDIANLTLSSAGSLPSTVNIIGAGVMSTDEFDNDISKRKLGSVTQVDSGFLKGNNKTYADGLTLNAAEGTDGWLYSGVNITVTGGDTILNNIGFVNPAMLNISGSSLTINSVAPVSLSGNNITVNVTNDINITAGAGITVGADLTAGNDISLNASHGTINITGASATAQVHIRSASGNINLAGNGGDIRWATINSNNVTVSMQDPSKNIVGLYLLNSTISAVDNISVSLCSTKPCDIVYVDEIPKGGVILGGDVTLSGKNVAINSAIGRGSEEMGAGVFFGDGINNPVFNFSGNVTINSNGLGSHYFYAVATINKKATLNINDGHFVINATSEYGYGLGSVERTGQWADSGIEFNLINASACVTARSLNGNGVRFTPEDEDLTYKTYRSGLTLAGSGDFSLIGEGSDAGVKLSVINTSGFNGNVNITGVSENGPGVNTSLNSLLNTKNINITGKSNNGAGIVFSVDDGVQTGKTANLNGNTLCGTSASGDAGVQINGNNVTITNGTVNGTVTSGEGSGVVISGG